MLEEKSCGLAQNGQLLKPLGTGFTKEWLSDHRQGDVAETFMWPYVLEGFRSLHSTLAPTPHTQFMH